MQVGDEFRLQTREGSDWDREFRNRQTRLGADPSTVQHARERILYAELDRVVKSLKIQQGYFRQSRTLVLHHDDTPPSNHPDAITIWVRDEWSGTLKEHVDAARRAGSESPMLFAFIPKLQPEDLRKAVIDAEAADQTLGVKGSPASPEGIEARRGMESPTPPRAARARRAGAPGGSGRARFPGWRHGAAAAGSERAPQGWSRGLVRASLPAIQACRCHIGVVGSRDQTGARGGRHAVSTGGARGGNGTAPGLSAGHHDDWCREGGN
jgi:hypothetical protein